MTKDIAQYRHRDVPSVEGNDDNPTRLAMSVDAMASCLVIEGESIVHEPAFDLPGSKRPESAHATVTSSIAGLPFCADRPRLAGVLK